MQKSKFYTFLKKRNLINVFLIIFIEGYLEILISSCLNYFLHFEKTWGDRFSLYVSYFGLVWCLIILPISLIGICFLSVERLDSPYAKAHYGGLYDGLRYWRRNAILNNFLYIVRRCIFIQLMFNPYIRKY